MNLKLILAKFSPYWNNGGLTFSLALQQSILNTITVSSDIQSGMSGRAAFFMANRVRMRAVQSRETASSFDEGKHCKVRAESEHNCVE